MNQLLIAGTPLVGLVLLDGAEIQRRVTWTRNRHGQLEGKLLGNGRWVPLRRVWIAR
jgi:hypothetical protein